MLQDNALIAFVATTRPEQAKKFYGEVLGLRLVSDEPWAIVFDAHGTMLRIQKTDEVVIVPYTSLGWRVPDILAAIDSLSAKGVEFTRYGFMDQDEHGVWTAPDGTKLAWFKDPDGNTLSLSEGPTTSARG